MLIRRFRVLLPFASSSFRSSVEARGVWSVRPDEVASTSTLLPEVRPNCLRIYPSYEESADFAAPLSVSVSLRA